MDLSLRLSKREIQVLKCIIAGMPNKKIAQSMHISERTVKFHCSNIYCKLGVYNRSSLLIKLSNLSADEKILL